MLTTPHISGSTTRIVLTLLAGSLATGCNLDRVTIRSSGPQGPVAVLSKPGGVELIALDITVVDASEVDLIERMAAHRAAYHSSLRQLRAYYNQHGYATKEAWAAFELEGLETVKTFRYLMDAEIPGDALRAADSIAEADAMFEQGKKHMRRGGYDVPGLYRQSLMVKAADTFRRLIERFPGSDKIDDAAFMMGEIHKDFFDDQEQLAVRWYERVWAWNPQTPLPARFKAARIYDFRLHDRVKALELYNEVLASDMSRRSNVQFAAQRIFRLTKTRQTDGADAS